MSWVTIAVFAILILFGVSGWRKGIIRLSIRFMVLMLLY